MAFRIASSPYTHNHRSTPKIMLLVVIAALPGILMQRYYFGWGNLIQVTIAIVTALASEGLALRLRSSPVLPAWRDCSAVLTALLLGISIPPLAPWWMVVIGTAFAIIIAKQLYGGLGQNPFNPAMIGYVVLLISFPVQMTSWLPPRELLASTGTFTHSLAIIFNSSSLSGETLNQLREGIDGISQATPLDNFKTGMTTGHNAAQLLAQPIYRGVVAGLGWQWINVGFLIGGVFLFCCKAIRWHIPVSFLLSLTLCATISWLIAPDKFVPPSIQLFSGATMLGAFFIATDPVTASTTNNGRLIFGTLIGMLTWLIRSFGGYPDGVAFAVLLANIAVPLIDYYTQPRVYGHKGQ